MNIFVIDGKVIVRVSDITRVTKLNPTEMSTNSSFSLEILFNSRKLDTVSFGDRECDRDYAFKELLNAMKGASDK